MLFFASQICMKALQQQKIHKAKRSDPALFCKY